MPFFSRERGGQTPYSTVHSDFTQFNKQNRDGHAPKMHLDFTPRTTGQSPIKSHPLLTVCCCFVVVFFKDFISGGGVFKGASKFNIKWFCGDLFKGKLFVICR